MFSNHILSISFENNGRPSHLLASISAAWWQLETCIVLIIPSWFYLFFDNQAKFYWNTQLQNSLKPKDFKFNHKSQEETNNK